MLLEFPANYQLLLSFLSLSIDGLKVQVEAMATP